MANPERVTVISTLGDVARRVPAKVVSVDERFAVELAAQGLYPGRVVRVMSDAPFGGPRIVEVGAARLAVARRVARAVQISLEPGGAW